eukprot:COSAG06_NODE_15838_length_1041_cov_0.898089_3_plen_74_part_01
MNLGLWGVMAVGLYTYMQRKNAEASDVLEIAVSLIHAITQSHSHVVTQSRSAAPAFCIQTGLSSATLPRDELGS